MKRKKYKNRVWDKVKNTYTHRRVCKNCSNIVRIEIEKGTYTMEYFRKNPMCPVCKCLI